MKPLIVVVLAACGSGSSAKAIDAAHDSALDGTSDAPVATITGLHASGNHIVDVNGTPVRLLGVNRSGTEYACIQGFGIFDGPSDDASIAAIASWHVNVVRVPLNEDCWLAINNAPAAYSGATYQAAITDFVGKLNAHGIAAIVEMHWNAPGTMQATGQQQMPDEDHAPAFWTSVAGVFGNNGSVILDLYNEPHDIDWSCWQNGGTCSGVSFQVAGMQELLDTVRGAGAKNLVMMGGLAYSNDLSGWLAHEPTDSMHNLAAAVHIYGGNTCADTSCFDSTIAPVAAQVPLVAGELGETYDGSSCATTNVDTFVTWMDAHDASYLAWVWDTWSTACADLSLITNYDGTPKDPNGTFYKAHLATQR